MLNQVVERVASLGAAGGALFVLFYAACCVAFLPISPLTLAAGAVYGVGTGFALAWTGASLGACASFLVGRRWLRAWVEKKLARHPVFAAIDAAISGEGRRVVFLTRLTLFPFNAVNYAYGLTRVGFRDYALASIVGMAPGTFLFVYLGAAAGRAVIGTERARTPAEWAFFAAGVLASAVAMTFVGRAAKRALAREPRFSPSPPAK